MEHNDMVSSTGNHLNILKHKVKDSIKKEPFTPILGNRSL